MVTHRRVARPNSQDSRHGSHKSEGVVNKTAEMSEQGSLAGSNPASPTSYNKGYEIQSKQVALHPNWLKPTSYNLNIK